MKTYFSLALLQSIFREPETEQDVGCGICVYSFYTFVYVYPFIQVLSKPFFLEYRLNLTKRGYPECIFPPIPSYFLQIQVTLLFSSFFLKSFGPFIVFLVNAVLALFIIV